MKIKRKLTKEEKAARNAKMKKKQEDKNKKWQLQHSYKRRMKAINRGDIREPTYIFKHGDRVQYGNWDYTRIIKVLEGGKLYLIVKITENIKYGRKVGTKSGMDYLLWTEIRPYRTSEEKNANPIVLEDDDIKFGYSQRSLSSIFHLFQGGSGIDLNPDYQREIVWGEDQKVALIDSIFKNIDIGKFTIIRRSFKENLDHYYEVLDGKQRIMAVLDFFECRFKYKGLTYNDLNWKDQSHFKNYSISWGETEPLTDEQKYRYFLKLNTGGVPISKEHIDKVREMWNKLNTDDTTSESQGLI